MNDFDIHLNFVKTYARLWSFCKGFEKRIIVGNFTEKA